MALFLKLLWDNRKVALYTLLAVALGAALWRVNVWRASHERLQDTEDALRLERACGEGSECQKRQAALEAAQRETTAKVVGTYEAELAGLRNRPARVVRLCPGSGNVQGARPTGTADGTGTAAGELPGQAGRDIGPDLYQLAREADEVAARLRALQEWNSALAR